MIKIKKCYKIIIETENDSSNIEISSDEDNIIIEDNRSGFIIINKKIFDEFVDVLVQYQNEMCINKCKKETYRNMFSTIYSEDSLTK